VFADGRDMTNVDRYIPSDVDAELTPKTRAFVHQLFDRIDELTERVEKLEAMVAKLEATVARLTPQNSSIPPSTVHPHAKPISTKPKSSKKRGGQPGHKRHVRPLVPTEQCKQVIPLIPTNCRKCAEPLEGIDPAPLRHQICEIPPIVPEFTEYQRHRLYCSGCGVTTCAELPAGVPQGQTGPRLMAFTAMLMGHFRQSKRMASEFLQDLLNVPCCPSLTVKIQKHVCGALAKPHDELKKALADELNLHMDETPTKQGDTKAWLWTAVAKTFVVFAVFPSRAATAIVDLLGENFRGIVNCDRAKMYFQLPYLQWCWAHLMRDIQAMIDSKVPDRVDLGQRLSKQMKIIFERWHRFKDGQTTWDDFRFRSALDATQFNELLHAGTGSHDKKLRNQCKSLYAQSEHLWRFLTTKGIEPTNNTAERALRPAVIYRKLSFGTQSDRGSRFVERIFTVLGTCRMQKRNGFEFLVQAIQADLTKQPAPSLLPNSYNSQSNAA
jgi:transposase